MKAVLVFGHDWGEQRVFLLCLLREGGLDIGMGLWFWDFSYENGMQSDFSLCQIETAGK